MPAMPIDVCYYIIVFGVNDAHPKSIFNCEKSYDIFAQREKRRMWQWAHRRRCRRSEQNRQTFS